MAFTHDPFKNSALMQNYNYHSHPLANFDITALKTEEIEQLIKVLNKEYDRRTMHTPMTGPTRAELQNNPALKEAWEAYQIVKRLQGEKK